MENLEEKRKLFDKRTKGFEEAVRPAIKWLNENCHPHTTIVLDSTSAELLEGIKHYKTNDFIKD